MVGPMGDAVRTESDPFSVGGECSPYRHAVGSAFVAATTVLYWPAQPGGAANERLGSQW